MVQAAGRRDSTASSGEVVQSASTRPRGDGTNNPRWEMARIGVDGPSPRAHGPQSFRSRVQEERLGQPRALPRRYWFQAATNNPTRVTGINPSTMPQRRGSITENQHEARAPILPRPSPPWRLPLDL